jgi:hypothetical protein
MIGIAKVTETRLVPCLLARTRLFDLESELDVFVDTSSEYPHAECSKVCITLSGLRINGISRILPSYYIK